MVTLNTAISLLGSNESGFRDAICNTEGQVNNKYGNTEYSCLTTGLK